MRSDETVRMITVKVNGHSYRRAVNDRKLLLDFIREDLGLTGTHAGCEHGVCGACTILWNGKAVRSCLMFAVQAEGCELRTVESIRGPLGGFHPLQVLLSKHHGLQCGFCTPGILMTAMEMLEEGRDIDRVEIANRLSGNLCRCTGYYGIVDAVEEAIAQAGFGVT